MCCFQSAKRCEIDLNLDRLRDTMLDVLVKPRECLVDVISQDSEFCKNSERGLGSWKATAVLLGASDANRETLPQIAP